jgi:hypothetical protein
VADKPQRKARDNTVDSAALMRSRQDRNIISHRGKKVKGWVTHSMRLQWKRFFQPWELFAT